MNITDEEILKEYNKVKEEGRKDFLSLHWKKLVGVAGGLVAAVTLLLSIIIGYAVIKKKRYCTYFIAKIVRGWVIQNSDFGNKPLDIVWRSKIPIATTFVLSAVLISVRSL